MPRARVRTTVAVRVLLRSRAMAPVQREARTMPPPTRGTPRQIASAPSVVGSAVPEANSRSGAPDLRPERFLDDRIRDVAGVVRHDRDGEPGNDLQHLVGSEAGAGERLQLARL